MYKNHNRTVYLYEVYADFDEDVPKRGEMEKVAAQFGAGGWSRMETSPGRWRVTFFFTRRLSRDEAVKLLRAVGADPQYVELVAARGMTRRATPKRVIEWPTPGK